jgi:hypothetical protein
MLGLYRKIGEELLPYPRTFSASVQFNHSPNSFRGHILALWKWWIQAL